MRRYERYCFPLRCFQLTNKLVRDGKLTGVVPLVTKHDDVIGLIGVLAAPPGIVTDGRTDGRLGHTVPRTVESVWNGQKLHS